MKFNPDSPFFKFINTLVRFIVLNLFFLVTCIPIFTIGTSFTALYAVLFKYINNEDLPFVKEYFRQFKINFKKSTITFILIAIMAVVFLFNILFWIKLSTAFSYALVAIFSLAAFLLFLTFSYIFPLLSQYDTTIRQSFKNAFLISLSSFKSSIGITVITAISIVLAYGLPFFRVLFLIFGVAFIEYCNALILNSVLKKYN